MIPKVIHQIWLGDAPLPAPRLSSSWAAAHPGWKLKLWTDDNRSRLRNEFLWETAPHAAARSDLLRYEILHQYGGLYVDVDFECRRNVEPLLKGDFVMAYENPRHLQTGFMACTPNHPSLDRIILEVARRWQVRVPESFMSGPLLIDDMRREPTFDSSITKILPGLIGPDSPDSYAVHRSLGSWHPGKQVIHRARTPAECDWGSHLPLLAGLWRRVPGEVVVEVGIGPSSTPFWVRTSLNYTGVDTDPSFCTWAGIQFRSDPHAKFIPAFLPAGIPLHRGEATEEQVRIMDETMACVAQHCPQKIDILMVDCFGAARSSAIKALAHRATTVVMHDTECWDGYYYEPVLSAKRWGHRFSLRPKSNPWSDAVTSYPVDGEDIRRAVNIAATQYWPPGYEWDWKGETL